jgi:hypothetical protein
MLANFDSGVTLAQNCTLAWSSLVDAGTRIPCRKEPACLAWLGPSHSCGVQFGSQAPLSVLASLQGCGPLLVRHDCCRGVVFPKLVPQAEPCLTSTASTTRCPLASDSWCQARNRSPSKQNLSQCRHWRGRSCRHRLPIWARCARSLQAPGRWGVSAVSADWRHSIMQAAGWKHQRADTRQRGFAAAASQWQHIPQTALHTQKHPSPVHHRCVQVQVSSLHLHSAWQCILFLPWYHALTHQLWQPACSTGGVPVNPARQHCSLHVK